MTTAQLEALRFILPCRDFDQSKVLSAVSSSNYAQAIHRHHSRDFDQIHVLSASSSIVDRRSFGLAVATLVMHTISSESFGLSPVCCQRASSPSLLTEPSVYGTGLLMLTRSHQIGATSSRMADRMPTISEALGRSPGSCAHAWNMRPTRAGGASARRRSQSGLSPRIVRSS